MYTGTEYIYNVFSMKFIEMTYLLFKKEELLSYLKCTDIKKLKLDEQERIGYTFKSLGAGFWAFKQKDFRKAITKIVMQVEYSVITQQS